MNGQQQQRLSIQFPAGCFIGFNAAFDRKASEQLVSVCGEAVRNGYSEITLCLMSIGGLLDFAYYAFNILEALPIKLVTHNIGTVQSAANLIFLCGDERYAAPGCSFLFHNTGFEGTGLQITGPLIREKLKAMSTRKKGPPPFMRKRQDSRLRMLANGSRELWSWTPTRPLRIGS
jgi:Clp protease